MDADLLLLHLKLRLMYKGLNACHKILWKNFATFELILLEQESAYIMELVSCKSKLFHPAIPGGRIWRKLGEHGEHKEYGKDGKHQPDY